jgi:hypothetical protein
MNEVFEGRKKGFEKKYELDQDYEFRVLARRDKLFGTWLAELLGLSGKDADDYIRHIVNSNFKEPGDQDMLDHAIKDFSRRGVEIDLSKMKIQLSVFFNEAKKQVNND